MARRSDHTREELKNLCVRAGYDLIRAEGLGEFSARKVARAVGYTVGTLYHVFDSYENFMLHIQGAVLDDWFDALKDDCGDDPTLQELASFYIYYAGKNYNTWSLLFSRPATSKEEMPDWYREKFSRLFEVVEKCFAPYVAGDKVEAAKHARLLWASIHGICNLSVTGKLALVGGEPAELMVNRLIDHYLKGMVSHG